MSDYASCSFQEEQIHTAKEIKIQAYICPQMEVNKTEQKPWLLGL